MPVPKRCFLWELPFDTIWGCFRDACKDSDLTVKDFRLINHRLLAYLYDVPLSLAYRAARADMERALAFMKRFRRVIVVIPLDPPTRLALIGVKRPAEILKDRCSEMRLPWLDAMKDAEEMIRRIELLARMGSGLEEVEADPERAARDAARKQQIDSLCSGGVPGFVAWLESEECDMDRADANGTIRRVWPNYHRIRDEVAAANLAEGVKAANRRKALAKQSRELECSCKPRRPS